MGPLLKKLGACLWLLLISASLLGAAFHAFPADHACTHDGDCPVCTAFRGARQLLKQVCPGPVLTAVRGPGEIGSPGRHGDRFRPPGLSSVDLKVRLNT